MEVHIAGETIILRGDKTLYFPHRGLLLVADVHLGKAAALRAQAVPMPGGSTLAGLDRLSVALRESGARELVFLGDLVHSRAGLTDAVVERVAGWRRQWPDVGVRLLEGNHDRASGNLPQAWAMESRGGGEQLGAFYLGHYPEARAGAYVLAGHLHPAVRLRGQGRGSARLPCYWFGAAVGVLPAFGEITGTALIRPAPGDRVMVVADSQVVEVSRPAAIP